LLGPGPSLVGALACVVRAVAGSVAGKVSAGLRCPRRSVGLWPSRRRGRGAGGCRVSASAIPVSSPSPRGLLALWAAMAARGVGGLLRAKSIHEPTGLFENSLGFIGLSCKAFRPPPLTRPALRAPPTATGIHPIVPAVGFAL